MLYRQYLFLDKDEVRVQAQVQEKEEEKDEDMALEIFEICVLDCYLRLKAKDI